MQVSSTTSGNGSQKTSSSRIYFPETFRSAPSTAKLPRVIFHNIRNSIQGRCQASQPSSRKPSHEVGGRESEVRDPDHPQGVLPQNWGGTEQIIALSIDKT
ncbi:hypothetical protein TNCV_2139871 [Trichonephila clavipes]|uniref:Uncharacterized protein n=1 Tax=Trichonephila clavipes TaxID=2585209 RepID=A0A8X6V133_TRICX|nr:hypothetical protein TNCV_2139871 [Trichonephila clavipes]